MIPSYIVFVVSVLSMDDKIGNFVVRASVMMLQHVLISNWLSGGERV